MSQDPDAISDFTMGPAGEFMRSLWRLNHALERVSRNMEASVGVTVQQRMMIRCVGKYPGMTATQLCTYFHLDAGTVSAALGRLERKGLIQRRQDHRDRRRVSLGLTAAGRALDGRAARIVEDAVESLLQQVGTKDATRTQALLRTLTGLLEGNGTLAAECDTGVLSRAHKQGTKAGSSV